MARYTASCLLRPPSGLSSSGPSPTGPYWVRVQQRLARPDLILPYGTEYLATITDTVGALDATTSSTVHATTDPLGVTDSRASSVARPLTNPIGALDAESESLSRVISSSVFQGDAFQADTFPVTADIGITDSVSSLRSYSRSLTDSLGLIDNEFEEDSVPLSPSDHEQIGDTEVQVVTSVRSQTDTEGLLDSRVKALGHTNTDPAGITDSQTHLISRTLTDVVGLVDARPGQLTRTLTNPLGLVDAARRWSVATYDEPGVAYDDPHVQYDGLTDYLLPLPVPTDALGAVDSAVQAAHYTQVVVEALGTTDAIQVGGLLAVEITNTIGAVDQIQVLAGGSIVFQDTSEILDSITVGTGSEQEFSDALGLIDPITLDKGVDVTDEIGALDSTSRELTTSISSARPFRLRRVLGGSHLRGAVQETLRGGAAVGYPGGVKGPTRVVRIGGSKNQAQGQRSPNKVAKSRSPNKLTPV